MEKFKRQAIKMQHLGTKKMKIFWDNNIISNEKFYIL